MTESLFGPLVSQWDIEQAIIATYSAWLDEYLAEVERQKSLPVRTIPRPPAPESIHGGIDLRSFYQTVFPEVIVVIEPMGEPELSASAGYTQCYQVDIGCVYVGQGSFLAERAEDDARAVASYYGAATMSFVQQPDLGGLAERVVMVAAPRLSLPAPDKRQLVQVVTTFHVWVSQVILESAGPTSRLPAESPEYPGEPEEAFGDEPTVEKTAVTVTAEQI